MPDKIATGIKTELWNNILESLKKDKWKVTREYNLFDKGMDFDFYELHKNDEEILFGWDNWFEGEMKCSEERMLSLENKFNTQFKYQKPENLSLEMIAKMKQALKRKK